MLSSSGSLAASPSRIAIMSCRHRVGRIGAARSRAAQPEAMIFGDELAGVDFAAKQIVAIQGFRDAGRSGLVEHHLGRVELTDAAAIQHDDPVAHGQRLRFTSRDMQKRDAQPAAYPAQFTTHSHAKVGVQRAEGARRAEPGAAR